MQIVHRLQLDMQNITAQRALYVKQGDKLTRRIQTELYSGGEVWNIPTDCKSIAIRYSKPDGRGGKYDRLPSGVNACLWTAGKNSVTVTLHPQMLTVPGAVHFELIFADGNGEELATFDAVLRVMANTENGIMSTDYIRVTLENRINLIKAELPENGTTEAALPELLLSPRIGDVVIGQNGWLAEITDVTSSLVYMKALGCKWLDVTKDGTVTPASIGAIPVPTGYKAEEDAVLAVAAVDAAGKPTEWRYRNMPDSLFFAPEIEIPAKPYSADDATTEIELGGYALLPEIYVRVGAIVVGKNGYMAEVTALNDDGDPVVRSTGDRLISNGFDGLFYTTYGANEFLRVAGVDADGKPVGFYSTPLQRLIAIPDADVPTEYNSSINPDASKLAALGDVDGYPAQPHVGDYVVGKNGYIAKMVSSDASGYPVVAGVGARLIAPPPHVVITLTGSGNSWTIGSATLSGKAVTLTNATGKADYSALIAAINKAVPEGGAVELQYSGALYTAQTSRNELSVLLSYLDICDPTSVTDGFTLLRVRLTADAATVTVTEV